MRRRELAATKERIDLLLRSRDMMQALFDAARTGGGAPADMKTLLKELAGDLAAVTSTAPPPQATRPEPAVRRRCTVIFAPHEDIFYSGMDLLLLLRDLAQLGTPLETHLDSSSLPELARLQPEHCYLAWRIVLDTDASEARIREVFAFVEDSARIEVRAEHGPGAPLQAVVPGELPRVRAEARKRGSGAEASSIRVPVEKVDALIDLVGELVISQSMVSAIVQDFTPQRLGQLRDAVGQMRRNTRELQGRVMAVRMVPIGSVFGRFPRLVRDLSATLKKEIELRLSGEETELDKSVVEQIADPLTHMVRNCADHGLENASTRLAAGKPAQGTIWLSASARNGSVEIEVRDDGRGLDTQRIRSKAEEKGLVQPEAVMSADEIRALIFLPGFSTASSITDLSGRGVGLDVVNSCLKALNGSIQIQSELGHGTAFRLKLPLSLAILDGLLLRVDKQVFVLALTSILETLRPRAKDLKTVLGKSEIVMVRGQPIPLLRLHELLEITHTRVDPCQAMVILVEHEGQRIALLVDELLGQQEVVIKSLDGGMCRVDGVLGATILGDGRVAMILDVAGLVRVLGAQAGSAAA